MKQCRNASIVKGAILNLNEIFRLVQENLEHVIMDSFFKFRKCSRAEAPWVFGSNAVFRAFLVELMAELSILVCTPLLDSFVVSRGAPFSRVGSPSSLNFDTVPPFQTKK